MGDVISLAERRAKKTPPTVADLSRECIDDIMDGWANFARTNRLNDFFLQSIVPWGKQGVDYLSNLNELSIIEGKIKLNQAIFAPEATTGKLSSLGWTTVFKVNGVSVSTPPMMCEAYARCFSILLFLKLKRECTKHNLVM